MNAAIVNKLQKKMPEGMDEFFVHRYKWSHSKLRSKCRKLHESGKIDRVDVSQHGFVYKRREIS